MQLEWTGEVLHWELWLKFADTAEQLVAAGHYQEVAVGTEEVEQVAVAIEKAVGRPRAPLWVAGPWWELLCVLQLNSSRCENLNQTWQAQSWIVQMSELDPE